MDLKLGNTAMIRAAVETSLSPLVGFNASSVGEILKDHLIGDLAGDTFIVREPQFVAWELLKAEQLLLPYFPREQVQSCLQCVADRIIPISDGIGSGVIKRQYLRLER